VPKSVYRLEKQSSDINMLTLRSCSEFLILLSDEFLIVCLSQLAWPLFLNSLVMLLWIMVCMTTASNGCNPALS
jgi:hypothetical protein